MTAPVPTNPSSLLIGRRREFGSLWHAFEAAANGHTSVALVVGEPGIGKSWLLDVVGGQARRAGALVLRGNASEAEGMPPYLPFLEALGQHIRTAPADELRAQTGPFASVLATILPELMPRLGESPVNYPLPPEQARLRLYEAVGMVLAAIAARRALLLILDDLQWADPASLDLLCFVTRHQPTARLLILGAYRAGESEQRPEFERAVTELNRLRVLRTVTIGPLSADEIADLARHALGGPVDSTVTRLLYTQSEGNPFFAEELLRGWHETGALVLRGGDSDRAYTLAPSVAPTLPPSIVSAVRQRVARLAPELIDLLRTAAIIGRTFDEECDAWLEAGCARGG
jgi:predicted ATPase